MKRIPSFAINHLTLQQGVYVSRKDIVGNEVITTFDIRMRTPNREQALTSAVQHTIEHLAATYLRNDQEWGSKVIYWGPMGCQTGSYLLLKGDLSPQDIIPLLLKMFRFIATYTGLVPGATAQECGNYLLHDLPGAQKEAARYTAFLEHITTANTIYPK